ncbi:MAG: hypothetical protein M1824_001964 [Vezdaea acicularis]|nr:MAG: hypothetical protein M1824_001964 [Vezdaea acicularis]
MSQDQNSSNGLPSFEEVSSRDKKKRNKLKPNSGNVSGRVTLEESQDLEYKLASAHESLRRIAGIAQVLHSTLAQDVAVVEGVYEEEITREKTIEDLRNELKTIARLHSEKTKALRDEVKELKATQEILEKESKNYQELEAQLNAENLAAEKEREEAFEKKVQAFEKQVSEQKSKFKKEMKAKRAEVEATAQKHVETLKKECQKEVENLKKECEQGQRAIKDLKRMEIVEEALTSKNKRLSSELERAKSASAVEKKPESYYAGEFQRISVLVEAVAQGFFRGLSEEAEQEPLATQAKLSRSSAIFKYTPISSTDVSMFLRLADVQHIIAGYVYSIIKKPFFYYSSEARGGDEILNEVSQKLSSEPSREIIWRALTIQGLELLPESAHSSFSPVKSTVREILNILQPLAARSEDNQLEASLTGIVEAAFALWQAMRKDSCIIELQTDPYLDRADWEAQEYLSLENVAVQDEAIAVCARETLPLCLFPKVKGYFDNKEDAKILHPGKAVFTDSPVFALGVEEQWETIRCINEATKKAVSEYRARRSSVSSPTKKQHPPNIPVGKIDEQPQP